MPKISAKPVTDRQSVINGCGDLYFGSYSSNSRLSAISIAFTANLDRIFDREHPTFDAEVNRPQGAMVYTQVG